MSDRELALRNALAELLVVQPEELAITSNFADLGVDSLIGLRFARKIEDLISAPVEIEWLFDYPTIRALSQFLEVQFAAMGDSSSAVETRPPEGQPAK